jgi:hypothetical protein
LTPEIDPENRPVQIPYKRSLILSPCAGPSDRASLGPINDNDEWILERERWESDEEYHEAAAFWRRELSHTDRKGISITEHLKAGRAVLIELKL